MARPRLCIVGPLLGSRPGWVLSQGEVLGRRFAAEGYSVVQTSSFPNRYLRLADIVTTLIRRRHHYDIVLLMVFSGPAFYPVDIASRLAAWLDKPLVLWLHGGDLPRFTREHAGWVGHVYRRAQALVSPSAYLAEAARPTGVDVEVIPNILHIVDYPFCRRRHVRPRLLWMRTFHDIYNPEMAVEVLDTLREAHPEATLTMAGQDKGLLPRIQEKVAARGVAGHVSFPGFLDLPAKQAAFAAHDIFLNTNRVDNMPVSVLEALACGLPVVATRVGGIPYLLEDERTALLVEAGNAPGMATAVRRLLAEPGLAARLSENGRQLAEASAWPRVRDKWEALFRRLVAPDP